MDQDIEIINRETRKEKIINFFIKNKKKLISIIATLILMILGFFSYQIYNKDHKEQIASKYNSALITYEKGDKAKVTTIMKEIINDEDKTYSPLALYFLIDNDLLSSIEEGNKYFDIIIYKVNLNKEIKYLNIYKKALFNSETEDENKLLEIINPLLKSNSIWKSHSLYLMGEYFYANGQYEKAKDFFTQLINLKNGNKELILESQKRLKRDLGEK
tara:strand:+ start:532 stop:1179 length:648 start_codon:yes stop_codon:yes gene_type:complete